ncbi:MAG: DsbC family protein [Methylophilaceae bacterium]
MTLIRHSRTNRLATAVLATLIPLAALADSDADNIDAHNIKVQFEKAYPAMKIKSVLPTPIPGLYEVFTNGNILYIDKSGQYVLAGATLVEDSSKRNLTAERMKTLTAIAFAELPLKDAIAIKKGNGAYKFAIFADPDCPHCKTLETGLEKLNLSDYTAYVFLLPLEELHPEAKAKAEAIWCAKDRNAAWENWMLKGTAPQTATCENPLASNAQLAAKLGVASTPTIYLNNGQQAQAAQELIAAIKAKP